jgi:multiple sugar transport system permease protein
MPVVVVGVVFTYILQNNGPFNSMLRFIGLGFLAKDWFALSATALPSIIVMIVWKDFGLPLILFLSRLTETSPSLFEAARIDGAGDLKIIRHITLPELKDIIVLYSIIACIGNLSALFPYINVTTNGGPGSSSTVLEYFIYLYTFRYYEMGQGAAASVILFIITFGLSITYFRLLKRGD